MNTETYSLNYTEKIIFERHDKALNAWSDMHYD